MTDHEDAQKEFDKMESLDDLAKAMGLSGEKELFKGQTQDKGGMFTGGGSKEHFDQQQTAVKERMSDEAKGITLSGSQEDVETKQGTKLEEKIRELEAKLDDLPRLVREELER